MNHFNVSRTSSPWMSCRLIWKVWGAVFLLLVSPLRAEVTTSFTEPDETTDVACAETGVVARVDVKQGQQVQAGAILAVLDHSVLEATLRAAEAKATSTARIDAAKVECDLKKRQKEKLTRVLADGHASANEIEKAESELVAAQVQLRIAEEEQHLNQIDVEQIKAQIERRTIRSPVDGVVTRVKRRSGEFVSGSDPVIATVVRLDHLRVRFYVSTELAERLQAEPECRVLIRGVRHVARIDFLSPVTDADSGTVRMEVLVDDREHRLRSGIPCQLEVEKPSDIPAHASRPVTVKHR